MAVHLPSQLNQVDRRLLRVGAPMLLTNGVLLGLPIIARVYLGVDDYSTWALLMTVVMAGFLFDLGGTAYLQSAGYGVRVGLPLYLRAVGLSCLGVLVVTTIAALAALGLSQTLSIPTSPERFVVLVVVTGLACAVRAAWTVTLARLQVEERFRLRTVLAMVQAVLQVGICWGALAAGSGLWSLALSLSLSTIPVLILAHLPSNSGTTPRPTAAPSAPLIAFASIRTVSAIIATASSQADRWVLASIAPAAFLTSYDLAVRLATVPISVVVTLFGGLIAESAAARGNAERRSLVARTTVRVGSLTLALSSAGFVIVLGAAQFRIPVVTSDMVVLLALALIWLLANALTAPTTMAFVGVGKPGREFYYTVPTVLCSAAGWVVSISTQNPWVVPIATLVSVTSWSLWFVYYGTQQARY